MRAHKHLELFVYCTFMVLLASILIGLTVAVWMTIYAGVIHV